ncbi:hypothetical protein [Corynebacterium cystitidis]|uniref:hypothetical protein n=1 Tax=Corynebacterium cystitidis TaxID=35757 RepID=UPI00211F10FA|nr:hypothetical protein [Corynebacterium cystitidis]
MMKKNRKPRMWGWLADPMLRDLLLVTLMSSLGGSVILAVPHAMSTELEPSVVQGVE